MSRSNNMEIFHDVIRMVLMTTRIPKSRRQQVVEILTRIWYRTFLKPFHSLSKVPDCIFRGSCINLYRGAG
jgi:hypothetical protein